MKANFFTIKMAHIINNYPKLLLFVACFLVALISTQGFNVEFLQKIDFYIAIFLCLLVFVYVLFSSLKISIYNGFKKTDNENIKEDEDIKDNIETMLRRTLTQIIYFFISLLLVLMKYFFCEHEGLYYEFDCFVVLVENPWLIYALTYSLIVNFNQAYSYLYCKTLTL